MHVLRQLEKTIFRPATRCNHKEMRIDSHAASASDAPMPTTRCPKSARRKRLAWQLADHTETVENGHLRIQEHNIGRISMDEVKGFTSVCHSATRCHAASNRMSLRRSANCWSTNASALPAEEAVACEEVSWATALEFPNAQIAINATATYRRLFIVSSFSAGSSSALHAIGRTCRVARPTNQVVQAACQPALVACCKLQRTHRHAET